MTMMPRDRALTILTDNQLKGGLKVILNHLV